MEESFAKMLENIFIGSFCQAVHRLLLGNSKEFETGPKAIINDGVNDTLAARDPRRTLFIQAIQEKDELHGVSLKVKLTIVSSEVPVADKQIYLGDDIVERVEKHCHLGKMGWIDLRDEN